MNKVKAINVLREGFFTIPIHFYKLRKELSLLDDEFLFLMYLINKENDIVLNPQEFSDTLGLSVKEVMNYISKLSNKGLLEVKTIKNDKDILEDYIILDLFYEKVDVKMLSTLNKKEDSTIFEVFEKELGKTLSPMEFEIIAAWIENGTNEELIIGALKEAVFNGVSNLRYIDKIIFEWNKKGYKSMKDVELHHTKKKPEEKKEEEVLFDFDWLEDDE